MPLARYFKVEYDDFAIFADSSRAMLAPRKKVRDFAEPGVPFRLAPCPRSRGRRSPYGGLLPRAPFTLPV